MKLNEVNDEYLIEGKVEDFFKKMQKQIKDSPTHTSGLNQAMASGISGRLGAILFGVKSFNAGKVIGQLGKGWRTALLGTNLATVTMYTSAAIALFAVIIASSKTGEALYVKLIDGKNPKVVEDLLMSFDRLKLVIIKEMKRFSNEKDYQKHKSTIEKRAEQVTERLKELGDQIASHQLHTESIDLSDESLEMLNEGIIPTELIDKISKKVDGVFKKDIPQAAIITKVTQIIEMIRIGKALYKYSKTRDGKNLLKELGIRHDLLMKTKNLVVKAINNPKFRRDNDKDSVDPSKLKKEMDRIFDKALGKISLKVTSLKKKLARK